MYEEHEDTRAHTHTHTHTNTNRFSEAGSAIHTKGVGRDGGKVRQAESGKKEAAESMMHHVTLLFVLPFV